MDATAWTEALRTAALSEGDARAVVASEPARALVLERAGGVDRDTLHAWALLGRVLADAGASPSLVAAAAQGVPWASEATRGALFESYVAAVRDLDAEGAVDAWRFPRCVVRLDARRVAVAASPPTDDQAALSAWADEVAAGLVKMGIRQVTAEGSARAALGEALATVEISLVR